MIIRAMSRLSFCIVRSTKRKYDKGLHDTKRCICCSPCTSNGVLDHSSCILFQIHTKAFLPSRGSEDDISQVLSSKVSVHDRENMSRDLQQGLRFSIWIVLRGGEFLFWRLIWPMWSCFTALVWKEAILIFFDTSLNKIVCNEAHMAVGS